MESLEQNLARLRSPELSERQVVDLLEARLSYEAFASWLGSSALVCLNPGQPLSSLNDASAESYCCQTLDDGTAETAQPHPFALAGRVFQTMRDSGESQTIIYSGIGGSGKTFIASLISQQLCRLDNKLLGEATRIHGQLKAVDTVLDAFGNAYSPRSGSHGSCFSRYTELHYDKEARLIGARVLAFGLDKKRTWHVEAGERSFNVFYQFLAGATAHERQELALNEQTGDYVALARSGTSRLPGDLSGATDRIALDALRAALKTLGFRSHHVTAIVRLLSAILLLGNITFEEPTTGKAENVQVAAGSRPDLEVAAALLGVSVEALEQVFVTQCRVHCKELCSIVVDRDGATKQTQSFIGNLYAALFNHIVAHSNAQMLAGDQSGATLITQLDLPGFQCRTGAIATQDKRPALVEQTTRESYHTFTVNAAAELLQAYLQSRACRAAGDGVDMPAPSKDDASELRLEILRGGPLGSKFDVKPTGLIGTLDQLAIERRKGKGKQKLMEIARSSARFNSAFVPGSGESFTIQHYAGSVTYDAFDFVEEVEDSLDVSILGLLKQSENPFLGQLFADSMLLLESHPRNRSTVVAARIPSAPIMPPATLDASAAELETAVLLSASSQFNNIVSAIFRQIAKVPAWTVFCLQPWDPVDGRNILTLQVKATGIVDLCTNRQYDYSIAFERSQVESMLEMSASEVLKELSLSKGDDVVNGRKMIWLSYASGRRLARALAAGKFERLVTAEDQKLEIARARAHLLRTQLQLEKAVSRPDSPDSPPQSPPISLQGNGVRNSVSPESEKWHGTFVQPSASMLSLDTVVNDLGKDFSDYQSVPILPNKEGAHPVIIAKVSPSRRLWLALVWMLTCWIPDFSLRYIGRMKRADRRLAWREKVTLCILITLLCGTVIFYIVAFGHILCPQYKYAWNMKELGYHQGTNDFWVGVRGSAYDITNFWRIQHSDIPGNPVTSDAMLALAGQDLSAYFPVPINIGCSGLTSNANLIQQYANFTPAVPEAIHTSGAQQPVQNTALDDPQWYPNIFLPAIAKFRQGPIVWAPSALQVGAQSASKIWGIYETNVYDLSDYFYTLNAESQAPQYDYLDPSLSSLFQAQSGQDLTSAVQALNLNATAFAANMACLNNLYFIGNTDFRLTAHCAVQNELLLAFSILLVTVIGIKFLAALQISTKRTPELRSKFVILAVPCYSEDEDGLRTTIDSLTIAEYDDKRKLIFVACDGMVVGRGNDKPTSRIVLDILGVDPSEDPQPLCCQSLGDGMLQLNFAKCWSGLYEKAGHVVPYIVVAKCGRPSERIKPGNRGKRDSQILLMRFLNRVHHSSPMSPLEAEIYHQIANVIGVDPKLYELLLTVDADTHIHSESLNRLVAIMADDSRILGLCGETRLTNSDKTLVTSIQVYEYYISHHLAKAFESLFGAVTCLPGCFTMYRLRTADKGRPLLISNLILDDYADNQVDTLHRKNLLHLGEDRYLTTLLLKHFPSYKTRFTPEAVAYTQAPEKLSVLLSQRRRWINSTVHNLIELMNVHDLCGLCLFSMRFVVFIDLLGTITLPSTTVYLVYLIVVVSTHQATLPLVSLLMLAAVYGLQVVLFLLKRQWQFIFWLLLYLMALPLWGFLLPIYSFWHFDDLSWGATRLIMDGGKKKIILPADEEVFDESMIPLRRVEDYQAEAWRSMATEGVGNGKDESPALSGDSSPLMGFSRSPSPLPQAGTHGHRPSLGSMASMHSMGTAFMAPQQAYSPELHHQRSTSWANNLSAATMMPTHQSHTSLPGHQPHASVSTITPAAYMATNPFMNPAIYGTPLLPAARSRAPSVASEGAFSTNLLGTMRPASRMPSLGIPLATNDDPDPSDEELGRSVRLYLSSQDLMQVTRRSARTAIAAAFPQADLSSRRAFLDETIDAYCRGA